MEDHAHDQGLLYDLATLTERMRQPALWNRRNALRVIGGGAAGLLLVACGNKSGSAKDASATTATTTAPSSATNAQAVPAETGGPFPGDGSNGPNVLNTSGVVRSDITKSFGGYSGTAAGVPLTINLRVINTKTQKPYSGAAIYLWHCTAEGGYSLYSQGVTNQNYLRGVQVADAEGRLTFKSVYPAAYDGRWPHIHYEVYPSLTEAAKSGSRLITSQIAMDGPTSKAVYDGDSRYSASVSNLARTSLATDMVFSDGAELETPTMLGSLASGYVLDFTVGV